MANSINTCMLFIGKTSCFSSLQVHLYQVIFSVSPQKMGKRLCFNACHFNVKRFPSLNISPLLYLSSSLIKSYLQARGGHSQDDQYATCHTPHTLPCYSHPFSNGLNSLLYSFFLNLSLVFPPFLICIFLWESSLLPRASSPSAVTEYEIRN